MKKYFSGVLTGFIVCTMFASTFAIANSPIKLIVNGKLVESDVPPQIINGRTMIPARPLAEALGADVRWDEENSAVVVTGGVQVGVVPTDLDWYNNDSYLEEPPEQIEKNRKDDDFNMNKWVSEKDLDKYGITVTKNSEDNSYCLRKGSITIYTTPNFREFRKGFIYNGDVEYVSMKMVDNMLYVNKEELETSKYLNNIDEPIEQTVVDSQTIADSENTPDSTEHVDMAD